jgi:3'-5' exoribonuclease
MSTRLPPIRGLQPNDAGYSFYLCAAKETRQGRGNDFLHVLLQDATGQIAARAFDNADELDREFDAGEFVKVQGRAQIHHGRLQLLVERIRRVIDSDALDGFREDDCIETSPRPVEEMWAELRDVLGAVTNPFVRELLQRVTTAEEARLRRWPAAVSVHHAYRGGLLEHILQVTRVVRLLAPDYGADVDIVTAGAVLHDIGKLDELDEGPPASYTREGNLLGHIAIGAARVREACGSIPGFPADLRDHIVHLILSHHGQRDRGSPVVPSTLEAFILSMTDDLDAKLHLVRRSLAADAEGGEFTGWNARLERRLWKGGAVASQAGSAMDPTT